jgi:hypothetical protein
MKQPLPTRNFPAFFAQLRHAWGGQSAYNAVWRMGL